MGREIKIAGDRTFDDWSVTVYNNSDFGIRKYFESWSNDVLSNFSNTSSMKIMRQSDSNGNIVVGYLQDAKVTQLGRDGNDLYYYEINGIFPTSISDISLAYDNNNTVEEFTVTFAVNYWMSKDKTNYVTS